MYSMLSLDDTFLITVGTLWLPMETLVNPTAGTFIPERRRGKHQPHIPLPPPAVGSGVLVGHGFTHPTNIYCIPS